MAVVVPSRDHSATTLAPVALIIDRSSSTEDIREIINLSTKKLIQQLKDEMVLKGAVRLLVVTYGKTFETLVDFKPLEEVSENDLMIAQSHGATDTGKALLYTMNRLDEMKGVWKSEGKDYFQPIVFLLTDGYPDAGVGATQEEINLVEESYQSAANMIKQKESANRSERQKIVFVAAGLQRKNGASANMEKLRQLTSYPDRILCVSEDCQGMQNIDSFFILLKKTTINQGTDIQDIMGDILDE